MKTFPLAGGSEDLAACCLVARGGPFLSQQGTPLTPTARGRGSEA